MSDWRKPSQGPREVPHKCGPDRFSRFDVLRIQKDKLNLYKDYAMALHVYSVLCLQIDF